MSLDAARAAYPILVQMARDLASSVREKRAVAWISYDELCARCKEAGIKETPRTIMTKLLRPIQVACIEREWPDLSALFIQKPKARGDFGNLIRPNDGWWETYVQRGESTVGDVSFWFKRYQAARDFAEWPEAPFF
ncbi:MAG: hypothetical protein NVSMB14_08530 [Isosphaeraceae bacterium]